MLYLCQWYALIFIGKLIEDDEEAMSKNFPPPNGIVTLLQGFVILSQQQQVDYERIIIANIERLI